MAFCNFTLDADIVFEFSTDKIDIYHLTRAQSSLFNDVSLVQVRDYPSLAHHVYCSVVRNRVSSRTESVAIKRCTDGFTIGENQESGPIPSFKQSSVEFVEVGDFRIIFQIRIVNVGGGHHGHESTRGAVTRLAHEFENRVEVCRVRTRQIDDRLQDGRNILCVAHGNNIVCCFVVNQITNTEFRSDRNALRSFTCLNPINVSEQSVDFTIVPNDTHGLRKRPAGVCVGRETTMVDDEFGSVVRVRKVFVEFRENSRLNHSFVDDGSMTERSHVYIRLLVVPLEPSILKLDRKATTDEVKCTLEAIPGFVIVAETLRLFDKELPNVRHGFTRHGSKNIWVDWNFTPSHEFQFIGSTNLLNFLLHGITLRLVLRQENHSYSRLRVSL
mmetsp:Transcript_110013/g.164605  ORF Transcript_110013/g.164605 Transcript_110013/m.164605 type:complete len:386 (-) Transcript_110013:536-1693(-)